MPEAPFVSDPETPELALLERAHVLALLAARTLERAHEPKVDLGPALSRIEGALSTLYDAYDGRSNRESALGVAHGRLWDAAIAAAHAGESLALETLFQACSALLSAEEKGLPATSTNVSRLTASSLTPHVHTLSRSSITPCFRAPKISAKGVSPVLPVVPVAKTFAELTAAAEKLRAIAAIRTERAEASQTARKKPKLLTKAAPPTPPEGFAFVPGPPQTETEFVRKWARTCVEEIGMLGVQRLPLEGDPWRTSQTLELRMLKALDAICALGPEALSHAETLAQDAPAPDPMMAFAVTMVSGTFEGRDAIAMAERILLRYGVGDPLIVGAFESAFQLSQNPFTNVALRSMASLENMGLRAFCTRLLAIRGALLPDELSVLVLDPDASIRASALVAMGKTHHRELSAILPKSLNDSDPTVVAAALTAMLLVSDSTVAASAKACLSGPLGEDALLFLAIGATEEDARFLLERARVHLTPSLAVALGWAGHLDAVPLLLDALASGVADVRAEAASALDRLLGANLKEMLEIEPDRLDDVPVFDPSPNPAKPRPTLSDVVDDERDTAPKGSTETLEVPARDPAVWRAYWAEIGSKLDLKKRTRRGQPSCPSVTLYELDRLLCSLTDRRLLQLELCYRTGQYVRFDPTDFVAVQEQNLKTWEEAIRKIPQTPGGW